jgi:spermidine/putrescine transport system permease protein
MTANGRIVMRKFTPAKLRWMRLQNAIGSNFVTVLTILTYLFLFVPMFVLIIYSFNAGRTTAIWEGFSLEWYRVLFDDKYIFRALKNSLIVATCAAIISTILGTLAALVLVRRRFKGKELFSTLMLAPLVLPEIVLGVSFLVFLVFLNIKLGFTSIILAHIILTLPFATLIVRASASGLDRRLEEAGADLGADEVQVFRYITFPLLVPGILAAFLLTFTISLDDFVMSMFAGGVGTTTLPLQIFSMLKLGITPEINALGTILIIFNLVLILTIGGQQLGRVMGGGSSGKK